MDAIMVELRPIALDVAANGVILDFELGIVNATNAPVDGIRLGYGMMSASETQDQLIAGFHGARLPPVVEPFKLGPREGIRIPGRIGLEADRVNVIDVGGRAMFVPLVMVDLRWSAGLSLKHQGSDFMVGMGRQGDKLGPIWLDRGAQRHERLNANRYVAKPVTVAAE
jgi:virulence-associated protein VagC